MLNTMALILSSLIATALAADHMTIERRLDNGLALTPVMGWNSYNHYSCQPNEDIIHSNAQAVIDLGLADAGYHYVGIDCGWTTPDRLANGSITWNATLFPSGFPAIGKFIHNLGLKFGVYSDGGIQMCATDSNSIQVGSLYHEQDDANSFAWWGADLLKYDNCYSDANLGYPDVSYTPTVSPEGRYVNISDAILATKRPIVLQICEWGIDFPSLWAPALGNAWRIGNDIIPAYRTVPRILNQAVPQTDFAGPGHWLDLDMLEVGNGVLSYPEEQTHFSLWAIVKSPLVIGCALNDTTTSVNPESLAILSNTDVISYNQDSLGIAASFKRRWTEDGYEVWAGPLSDDRTVVAVVNLFNETRDLTLALPDVGLQYAASLKDIWNDATTNAVKTSYTGNVEGHGTLLLELSNTVENGTYSADNFATTSGDTTTFSNIYGITGSSNYNLTLSFPTAATSSQSVYITSSTDVQTITLPSGSSTLSTTITILAANNNTITVVSTLIPSSLSITPPAATLYPSTSFTLSGSDLTACATDKCLPVGSKVTNISPSGSASINITSTTNAPKFLDIYFCNNDIAISTSWTTGTNTRNLTLAVNGNLQRIEVPLSGRSSEIYSVDNGWEDTGIFGVLTEGWVVGNNVLVVGNVDGDEGVQSYGADLVGVGVW